MIVIMIWRGRSWSLSLLSLSISSAFLFSRSSLSSSTLLSWTWSGSIYITIITIIVLIVVVVTSTLVVLVISKCTWIFDAVTPFHIFFFKREKSSKRYNASYYNWWHGRRENVNIIEQLKQNRSSYWDHQDLSSWSYEHFFCTAFLNKLCLKRDKNVLDTWALVKPKVFVEKNTCR
jgi:hypothetical protein